MAIYKGNNLLASISGGSSYCQPILSCMWFDHLLNDESWLRADTFSWQSGDTYKTVYDKLVEEYATGSEETEGSITFKRTTNGFKIATGSYESVILDKYNNDGIAWYYILDTTNKRFKLPRTKFGFEGIRSSVGDDIGESLPNIKGYFGRVFSGNNTSNYQASFLNNAPGTFNWDTTHQTYITSDVTLNASIGNSTYRDNAPVQERATQMYLYFYVGGYTQTATEQTAGLNSELFNNKLDIDLQNFNTSNLSAAQNSYFSGLGMPGNKYESLTLGSSGSTYIAPGNGYYTIGVELTYSDSYFQFNATEGGCFVCCSATNGGTSHLAGLVCPIQKGRKMNVYYNKNVKIVLPFKFIYAVGNEPQD